MTEMLKIKIGMIRSYSRTKKTRAQARLRIEVANSDAQPQNL
jgi:hypothetical protein